MAPTRQVEATFSHLSGILRRSPLQPSHEAAALIYLWHVGRKKSEVIVETSETYFFKSFSGKRTTYMLGISIA